MREAENEAGVGRPEEMLELEPEPNKRLEALREAAGLELDEMARRLDMNFPSYRDLEMHDDEIMHCADIGQVLQLCRILAIDPRQLFAKDPEQPIEPVTWAAVTRLARHYMSEREMALEEFSGLVGWKADYLQIIFNDPAQVQTWYLDGLNDLCTLVGVEWLAVLMAFYEEPAGENSRFY